MHAHSPLSFFPTRTFQTFITDIYHSFSYTILVYYPLIQLKDENVKQQDVQHLVHLLFLWMKFYSSHTRLNSSMAIPSSNAHDDKGELLEEALIAPSILRELKEKKIKRIFILRHWHTTQAQ